MDFAFAIEDEDLWQDVDSVFVGEFHFRVGKIFPVGDLVGFKCAEFGERVVVHSNDGEGSVFEFAQRVVGDFENAIGFRHFAVPENQHRDFAFGGFERDGSACGVGAGEVGCDPVFGEIAYDVEFVLGDLGDGGFADFHIRALDDGFAQVGESFAHGFGIIAEGFDHECGSQCGDPLGFCIGVIGLDFFEDREGARVLVAGEGHAHRREVRALHVVGHNRLAYGCAFLCEGGADRSIGIGDAKRTGEVEQPCRGF